MSNPSPSLDVPASPPCSPSLTERFREITDALMVGLCNRAPEPADYPPLPEALAWVICGWLTRLCKRFAGLVLRAARGTPRPARAQPSRAGQPRAARDPARSPFGYWPAMPHRSGWYLRRAGAYGVATGYCLRELLAEPEMAALVAVDPVRFARLLRPLCRALGLPLAELGLVTPPPALRAPCVPRAARALPESMWPRPGFERAASSAPVDQPGLGGGAGPRRKTA